VGAPVVSITFLLFWICCGAFVIDVLLGKIAILTGGAVHPFVGDVPHFLLLALTAVLLTAECLRREARRESPRSGSDAPSKVPAKENPRPDSGGNNG
jgi:hypothetical protein